MFVILDVIKTHRTEFAGCVRLLVCGNGEVDNVKAIINKEELSGIVSYEGWVSGGKKQALLNMSDALILPSYNEGLPLCVLEALIYDIPIIATHVGGIPELVHDGENGYLIAPRDKIAMYKAIMKAVENRDKAILGGDFISFRLCCSPVRSVV